MAFFDPSPSPPSAFLFPFPSPSLFSTGALSFPFFLTSELRSVAFFFASCTLAADAPAAAPRRPSEP